MSSTINNNDNYTAAAVSVSKNTDTAQKRQDLEEQNNVAQKKYINS